MAFVIGQVRLFFFASFLLSGKSRFFAYGTEGVAPSQRRSILAALTSAKGEQTMTGSFDNCALAERWRGRSGSRTPTLHRYVAVWSAWPAEESTLLWRLVWTRKTSCNRPSTASFDDYAMGSSNSTRRTASGISWCASPFARRCVRLSFIAPATQFGPGSIRQ